MARQTTAAPARPTNTGGGKQWTEEEKAQYQQQQERAFRNFAKYFQGQSDPKTRIPFLAKVIEMDDEPVLRPGFGGEMKMTSRVKVELVDKPVAGIRFQADLTDNPDTIKNPDAVLNHLYKAATGRFIPNEGVFNWDTKDILHESAGGTGRLVLALIQRGKDRDDGTRGGLYSELKDFQAQIVAPVFEDEDEADSNPQPVALTKPVSKRAQKAAAQPDPEDDEAPF